jgi:co-chaperonin GroES (HSP10)
MAWKPLNDMYLVQPDDIEVSSLVLEQFKKNHVETMTGTVISAGSVLCECGVRVPLVAKPGDRITFGSKVGVEIKIEGKNLLMIADANVLLIEAPNE